MRPVIAATNSPVDMSVTRAHDPARRLDRDVGQDRVADDDPATIQTPSSAVARGAARRRPPRRRRGSQARWRAPHRVRHPSSGSNRSMTARYQTARPGAAHPVVPVPSPRPALERIAQRAHRDDLEVPTGAPCRRSPRAWHDRPARIRGGRPRAGAGPGRGPGGARPAATTSPQATVPAAIGRSRCDDARARASGRSSAGSVDLEAAGDAGVDVVAAQVRGRSVGRAPRSAAPAGWPSTPASVRRGATHARPARPAPGPRPAAAGCPRAMAATATPGASAWSSPEEGAGRVGTSRRPSPAISKTPISSVEPKRFLARAGAAARRSGRPRAQHDVDEVLERRGPARLPSLVTWPTRTTGMSVLRANAPGGPPLRGPGRPSRPGPRARPTSSVWTESTISSAGLDRLGRRR